MKLIETLRKKLTEKKNELNKAGITTKDDYYLNENIYTFETAYKKVVENVFKESYDNVTNSFDIYEEMIDGSCDETKMIEEIINHIDTRYLDEEIERTEVLGCKVEKGHTIEEYREKFGELYDNGELWDFSVADFEEGAVEPDPDKTYWLLEDEDGELRYFEVCEDCVENTYKITIGKDGDRYQDSYLIKAKDDDEALEIARQHANRKGFKEYDVKPYVKESKELNEGTSNFPIHFSREYDLPLLIYFNYDEVLDKMDYEDDYPNEEDFENEEDYWEAKEEFEEKYFNDFEYCILDEDEHERLEDKIFDFNSKSKELEYDSDYSHPKLSLEPGYYEASYIDIDHDLDYLKKNAPEEADKQYERLINFLKELKKEFGLTELELASGPASNGETSFRKVEEYKLKEDTGYDHYGTKEMKSFDGPALIMYDGGPRQIEVITRARNGKYVWKNKAGTPDTEWHKFKSYEDALKVQKEVGGEVISYNEYMGIDDDLDEAKKKKNKNNDGPLISMVSDPEKSTELLNKELDVGDIVCEDVDPDWKDYISGEIVKDINDRNCIVKEDDVYYVWSKNWNRPWSKLGVNNEYIPIKFNTQEEAEKFFTKRESLKEEDGVAREEYCLMVDGDNIDCYDDEEEAIKSARHYAKEMQDRGLDRNVRVLLVKYGPKDEHGDEDELGCETIWAVKFDESLKESPDELGLLTDDELDDERNKKISTIDIEINTEKNYNNNIRRDYNKIKNALSYAISQGKKM